MQCVREKTVGAAQRHVILKTLVVLKTFLNGVQGRQVDQVNLKRASKRSEWQHRVRPRALIAVTVNVSAVKIKVR